MKRSFTYLLFSYILGIIFFYSVNISSNMVFFMFLFSIAYLSYNIIKSTLNQSVLLYVFLVLGIFASFIHNSSFLENYIEEEIYVEALVDGLDKQTSEMGKYIILVEKVNGKKIANEKSMLTIIGDRDLKLGSRLTFKTRPKYPLENTNPGLFNYKTYLKAKKIHTIMTVDNYAIENINNIDIAIKYRLKEASIEKIRALFKPYLNEVNNALISSIILGDSDYLDEENVSLYRDMGLAHILAVSGLHIGIISSFLMFMISRLGIKRRTNVILTLIFIWTYAFIIGYPPSILRASILFSFLYLSKIVHRPYDSINILSLAGLILLVLNPYSLFSIGFQLSFIASASIILFTERIVYLFYPLRGKLIETISSLLAVNIGVIPIQAYYFNRISIMGFLANLIILPILSFSLILAFIMIGLDLIFPNLNLILGFLLNITLNLQFSLLRVLRKVPLNIIKVFSPEIITILCLYLFFFIIFEIIDVKSFGRRIEKIIIIYCLFLLVVNINNIKENMEIHFIDVGQGDSIYIRTGKKDLLIDTGGSIFKNNKIPERILLPYLEKIGVKKLDAIFISHFHEDHCQGLPLMLENFQVGNIFISHTPTDPYKILLDDNRLIYLKKGDTIEIDERTSFKTLWPIDNTGFEDNLNNKSLVGVFSYKELDILFTGDMESEVEEKILDSLGEIDILKVGHHGSDTSSREDFIKKIKPKVGLISVGANNMYNHPSREVLNRFQGKTSIYRTDENGLVKVIIGDSYEVSSFLKEGKKQELNIEDYIFKNYNYFLYNVLFFLCIYIFAKNTIKEEIINEL